MIAPVGDAWFRDPVPATILNVEVNLLAPTELVWSKAFIMDRYKFDGSDIAHIILREHARIDWHRLLSHFEPHWEVLFAHLMLFRYIYPTERHVLPEWLLDELIQRLQLQRTMPTALRRPCRGRVFSRDDYLIDVSEWGFADVVGDDKQK
jgi:hypothetical protein